MSRLHIHHRTSYRCTAPVKSGMHRIVLRPREGLLQTCPPLTQDAEYDVLAVGAGTIRAHSKAAPVPMTASFASGAEPSPGPPPIFYQA
jgi:hypothetical protein